MVFDGWAAEGRSVALVNVRAPSAVALPRSAVPLGECPVPLCVLVLCCMYAASKEAKAPRVVFTGGTPPPHPTLGHRNMHGISRQNNCEDHLHPDNIRSRRSA